MTRLRIPGPSVRLLAAVAAVAIVAGGCGTRNASPSPRPPSPAASPVTNASAGVGPAGEGFAIGLEYGVPGLADAYRASGITRIKPALEFGVWGNLEPVRGKRDFRPLDNLVNEYQAAGFRDTQLLISADSPWAARRAGTDPMPQDQYLADYAGFVRAVVERYDGDGRDDAPGLRYPVHEYGIERELSKFWGSSAADYIRMLEVATPAIRQADPAAHVLMAAILAIDVFNGSPDAATVEQRWRTNEPFRKSRADVVAILAACHVYDHVDVHSLGDATEIAPTLAWIRARLSEAGCPDRPIWIGDAFPMSALVAYNNRPIHPTTDGQRATLNALLGAAVDAGDREHAGAVAWVRSQVARGLARKVVLAAAAGARGINLGNLEDWTIGLAPADRLFTVGAGTAVVSGHLDTSITNARPGGPLPYEGDGFSRTRRASAQRPSYVAISQVAAAMRGVTGATRVDVGSTSAWVYRLDGSATTTGAATTWVAWLDDGTLDLPGAATLTREVKLAVTGSRVAITAIATEKAEPGTPQLVEARDGKATVALGRTPVVITAQ